MRGHRFILLGLGLLIPTIVAAQPLPEPGLPFDDTGTLELFGVETCLVFRADHPTSFLDTYLLEDYGGFGPGTRVRVIGDLQPCVSFCTIVGCIMDNTIQELPVSLHEMRWGVVKARYR